MSWSDKAIQKVNEDTLNNLRKRMLDVVEKYSLHKNYREILEVRGKRLEELTIDECKVLLDILLNFIDKKGLEKLSIKKSK